MLELSTKMYEEKEKLKAEEAGKKKLALSKRIGSGARTGVTIIKRDSSGSEVDFIEACEIIEPKEDRDKAMELLGWKLPPDPGVLGTWEMPKVNVRIEDLEKREMPLHKLARNHEYQLVKRVYEIVLHDPKGGKDAATADMNSQNKDGKTPLMIAVEGNLAYLHSIEGKAEKIKQYRDKQVKTVDLILSCTADMYAESTTNNWNVLHCAAHGGSYEAAQSIFMYMVKHAFSTLAVRMLVNHPDKDGRTPLHVAAMRCDQASLDPPFVKLLLNKGADPLIKDTYPQALTAAALAEKANRPNAKAMLEKAEEAEQVQRASYRRRVSREV
jgi:ankyrin repeat protein